MKRLIIFLILSLFVIFAAQAVRVQINNVPANVTTFTAQNESDSTTSFQVLDADGGTSILNIDTTNERVGIGTDSPNYNFHVAGTNLVSQFGFDPAVIAIGNVGVNEPNAFVGGYYDAGGNSTVYFSQNVYFSGTWVRPDNTAATAVQLIQDGSHFFYTGATSLGSVKLKIENTGNVGIATTGPDRKLDVLDASNPPIRWTHTDGTNYGEVQPDASGDTTFTTSGDEIKFPEILVIGQGTKHDGYVIRTAAELQTGNAAQQTLDSFTLVDDNVYGVKAKIAAFEDGVNRAYYEITTMVYRDGGGATLGGGGVISIITDESEAAWDATFTVDTNDIRISVTGEAATTIEWGCTMSYINVGP